jgi:thiol-disulfide isomerase/thioredoxin
MKHALRWALVVALLAGALVVALWPRANPASAPSPITQSVAAAPSIEQLRSQAALQPCPSAHRAAGPSGSSVAGSAGGPLSGLVLPCLGQPGTVELAAALAGRPALLNLWGPLCQPCAQELPALAAYAAEPGAVAVLGVEVQQLPSAALEELAALNVHFPSVSDPEGKLRAALHAPAVIPLTYLVSADGKVAQVNPPEVMRSPEQVRAVVVRYLGPGASE